MADDPTYGPRIHPRIKTQARVSIARADPPDVVAETVDVSLSGVLFQCAALGVEVNDLVRVTLQVGDGARSLPGHEPPARHADR